MKIKNTVTVLLSTYNGGKYLCAQLDSLLAQKGVDVNIIVRDDGSTDNTIDIIKQYQSKNSSIMLIEGLNCGVEKSFEILTLIASRGDSEYYAYCDQDDVWFPEKLSKSISAIEQHKIPCLFCCNQMITDANLNPIQLMIKDEQFENTKKRFASNFFLNRHGCTMVWNRELQNIIVDIGHSKPIIPPHDSWIMLVAQCAGKVILGKEPLMYYRIHGSNTGGLEMNRIKRLKKGYKLYLKRDGHRSDLAKDCLFLLNKESKKGEGACFVQKVASYKDSLKNKLILLCSKQIWQYRGADGIVYAISILLDKY